MKYNNFAGNRLKSCISKTGQSLIKVKNSTSKYQNMTKKQKKLCLNTFKRSKFSLFYKKKSFLTQKIQKKIVEKLHFLE